VVRPLVLRTKTSEVVVDYVLDEIFEGRLRAGDRIDFEEVGKALDVSRSPVREALVILERDGIVSIRHHRGVFVEPFDADSIMDDFEVMGLLSGLAVARLARRPDPAIIAELEGLIQELRAAADENQGQVGEIVQRILRTEHRAGGSRRLRAELRSFAGYLPWTFRVGSGGRTRQSAREHSATVRSHSRVVQAISAGDSERASSHRVEDFRRAGKMVVDDMVGRGVLDVRGRSRRPHVGRA
jgi:DNA-binding GntR family transcriptional regulator